MKKTLILFLIAIILPSIAFATGSVSITGVTIPSSVTTGDSFTITMSVSGTEATSMQCSLTLPDGISCTGGTQSCDSGSASWSCTANVAGDYSNQITASISASYSGQTLSDTQQTGLQVLSPASLTSSSTINASSITTSGAALFTVGVNNAGGASTTYSISLSYNSSVISVSPTSVSTTSIDGSTLKNHAFTITPVAAGTSTITATITGNGQTLTASQSLTVTAVSTTTTTTTTTTGGGSSTGSTSSGAYVTLAKGKVNITTTSITTSGKMIATIARYEDIAIRGMNITVVNNVANIKIMISKISLLPSTIPFDISGKVYHYINIDKINITDSDINIVNIEFAVNKTWLTNNNVDASNITLYRWANNKWNDLNATKIAESTQEVFYNAKSSGLSVFIIGTKGGAPAAPTGAAIACVEQWQCTPWSACTGTHTRTCTDSNNCGTTVNKPEESETCTVEKAQVPTTTPTTISILTTVIVIVVAIIACVFIFLERTKISYYIGKVSKRN